MPWEKSFEESDVLEHTMQVFWEKGYAATSIADLVEATGVKRGSLYNAFAAGKQELFLKSLLKYDLERRSALLAEHEAIEDPRRAISKLFDRCVRLSLEEPRRGCLLVNTSLEIAQHDEEVQRIVSCAFGEFTTFFETLIKRGQAGGSIPERVKPRQTARSLVALLVGIRVLGRGAMGKSALQQIAREAKRLLD